MPRNPNGSIAIGSVRGRLRLQFPRKWFNGQQKYHALGLPDTKDNRLYAAALIREMEWDYLQGKFDPTLAKYLLVSAPTEELTLSALWVEYCKYKARSVKRATIHYLVKAIGVHITQCPYQSVSQALEIREWLLDRTTPDMAKRTIASLCTAVQWGIKHGKLAIASNPFLGMAGDIRVENEPPPPNALRPQERERVLIAFSESEYYRHYLPLVRFWLLTGCRPSEAIGLEWEQISVDFTSIRFDRSIIRIGNEVVKNRKSKTNRIRSFPVSEELELLLRALHQDKKFNSPLVFLSPTGKPINYANFCHRAWLKVVEPVLGRKSTPYSCRDTFITEQIGKGIPIAVIAKWCDNSQRMIEQRYLDPSALDRFKPL
jgi:integrase